MNASWEPDYRNIVAAATNQRPARLPIYEHSISPEIMSRALGVDMITPAEDAPAAEYRRFYERQVRFWREMTYDTMSFEAGSVGCWDHSGAIYGGKPGPIQNRADFEKFPFADVPRRFWERYRPHFEALSGLLPEGMKLIGGAGYGVFEISEDLVGYESLCLLQFDDPRLFADLYVAIGDMMLAIWSQLLADYGDLFCVCRMGDDLGYRAGTMLAPETIREHIVPQHRRIVALVHRAGKPFLLHSCGCIFSVMEDLIGTGIDAKHSNEDGIAPYGEWIERYHDRIGLFGGIDVDRLCRHEPAEVYREVVERATEYRRLAKGYALGSGNSIPEYVPLSGYQAMIDAANELRRRERAG